MIPLCKYYSIIIYIKIILIRTYLLLKNKKVSIIKIFYMQKIKIYFLFFKDEG